MNGTKSGDVRNLQFKHSVLMGCVLMSDVDDGGSDNNGEGG